MPKLPKTEDIIEGVKFTAGVIETINDIAQHIKNLAVMFEKQKAELQAKGPMLKASFNQRLNKNGNEGWYEQLANLRYEHAEDKLNYVTRIVKSMVDGDVNLNAADNNGDTLLHRLANDGNKEAVMILIAAGADINLENSQGKTALQIAEEKNNGEVVNVLKAGEISKQIINPESHFRDLVKSTKLTTLAI